MKEIFKSKFNRLIFFKFSTKIIEKNDIFSTLFHHNKLFSPIIISNFNNFDFSNIKNRLKKRGYLEEIIIDQIIDLKDKFKDLCNKSSELTKEKEDLLLDFKEGRLNNIEHARDVRKQLQFINNAKNNIMTDLTLKLLSLPNDMDHTPNIEWSQFKTKQNEISSKSKIVIERDNMKNNSLSREKFIIMEHSYDWWVSKGYTAISLSDICKTPTTEACNGNIGKNQVALTDYKINTKENAVNPYEILFLSGSASLESFCSYFMRTRTANKCLPTRLVTLGNHYSNKNQEVTQNFVISILLATKNVTSMNIELNNLLTYLQQYWNDHFNIQLEGLSVPCDSLNNHECHRYVLQNKQLGIAARVSVIGDYLSRRLMINSGENLPLYLIYAQVLDFNSLRLFIERSQNDVVFQNTSSWIDDF